MLVGRNLSFDVDGRRVLDDVSLTGEPGRMLAVTGSSGSGKTTLLSLVGGLARPTAGEASYDGGPVTTKQGEPLPGTGFVLQSYGLVTTLTASENVAIALRGRGVAAVEATEKASEALARVGVDELADRLISELSGGQLQRVAVARQRLGGLLGGLHGGDAPTAQGDGDVLRGGERGDQAVALEDETGARERLALLRGHRPAVVRRLAGRRTRQPADQGEQRGLAGAGRTGDGQHLPGLTGEGHVVEDAAAVDVEAEPAADEQPLSPVTGHPSDLRDVDRRFPRRDPDVPKS